ncbi:uncharacterized protein THITE_2014679, partial [Thermothielavioides terrestris NRRL 8126]
AQSSAPRLVLCMALMAGMSFLFMTARLACKRSRGRRPGPDDWILLSAWLFLATYVALTISSTTFGVGRHLAALSEHEIIWSGKLLYIGEFFAIIAVAVGKTSFAVTLLGLVIERWQTVLLWSVIVSVNGIMWTCATLLLAQCRPTEKLWNFRLEGECWAPHIFVLYSVFSGAWSAAMDVVIAMFPWVLLLPTRMKLLEKIGIGVAMSLGVFAGITGTIKTIFLFHVPPLSDFTYCSTNLLIWAAAESAVIISAASIPFLRPLLKAVTDST